MDGLSGRSIEVSAKHPVYRSYMYADDLVIWLMTIVAASGVAAPIFNVGSDVAYTVHEVAQIVADFFGVEVDANQVTDDKIDRYVPSIAKAQEELGLHLRYDLKSAIAETTSRIKLIKN